jgi:hypothetical protein
MKSALFALVTFVPLVLICQATFAQENGNGRHSRLYAVPAPGRWWSMET